ncbi:MAG: hypothetical protein IPI60_06385 [Saprospiraceae bacterium]|nr:hypothetical protein [Saprospiraceae bacterium]
MKKYYFQSISILLLVLSLIAFSDNLITDVGQKSNSSPMFIIHGLIMFAWFIVFAVQANFIRKGNYISHMRWGIAGMITAIGVFLSTLYVFITVYKGWDAMAFYIKANRFFMLSFAVLVALAYIYRKNRDLHKRFILMSTLLIMEPILSRVSGRLNVENFEAFLAIIWNALFISLFVYDWILMKKVHKITWMGFLWFYIVYVISTLI